jgi:hypothetical protein
MYLLNRYYFTYFSRVYPWDYKFRHFIRLKHLHLEVDVIPAPILSAYVHLECLFFGCLKYTDYLFLALDVNGQPEQTLSLPPTACPSESNPNIIHHFIFSLWEFVYFEKSLDCVLRAAERACNSWNCPFTRIVSTAIRLPEIKCAVADFSAHFVTVV